MSGVVALFDRVGGVSRESVERLLGRLDHRGPDGSDVVVAGAAGLGHQQFDTTPEAVGERQPLRDGDLVVSLDGRIDNRAGVLDALRRSGEDPAAAASDAELVLRSYRRWGRSFVDRLLGAFAVVLWDGRRRRLVCARDRTGIRHLYYATAGDALVVASETSAVLAHPAVEGSANRGFLAEYLRGEITTCGETFYEDVRTLERGERLVATSDGVERERYWRPGGREVVEASGTALAARFRRLLDRAVRCRLRARSTPAVSTSGGLDSTAIACLAARASDRRGREPPRAYSILYEETGGRALTVGERRRVRAVADHCDLSLRVVGGDEHAPDRTLRSDGRPPLESPCRNAMGVPNGALYGRVADEGRRVVLRGEGGNLHDGSRAYYLDLLRRGRVGDLAGDLRADPQPAPGVLVDVARIYAGERRGGSPWRPLAGTPFWLNEAALAGRPAPGDAGHVATGARLPATAEARRTFAAYANRRNDFKPALERREALARGVELRFPFWDARLVEFALSLPAGVRFRAGTDKRLFRATLDGVLPDVVRTCETTPSFDPVLGAALRRNEAAVRAVLDDDARLVGSGLVDPVGLRQLLAETFRGDGRHEAEVWRCYAVERWLRAVDG